MRQSLLMCALLLALSGCEWMGRQADALGEYLPVIGDRCEHWQCMTDEGEARSNAIKATKTPQQPQKEPSTNATPPNDGLAPDNNQATPH